MRYRIIDTVEHHIEAASEAEAERRFLRGEGACIGVISRAVTVIRAEVKWKRTRGVFTESHCGRYTIVKIKGDFIGHNQVRGGYEYWYRLYDTHANGLVESLRVGKDIGQFETVKDAKQSIVDHG